MMTSEFPTCPQCVRKIMQSVSNRCMYCGADLPEVHHLSAEEKNRLLTGKLEQMRQNEESADELVSAMRRNFGMPDRKPRMATKKDKRAHSSQAVDDALADIQDHIEQLRQQRQSSRDD
ncbi:MAG: hypothetical protein ACO3R5_06670 [Pseudohongiellaceae bacterium]